MRKVKMPPNGFGPPPPREYKWFSPMNGVGRDQLAHYLMLYGNEDPNCLQWVDEAKRGYWTKITEKTDGRG